MIDIEQFYPIIIIGTGAFISLLIVVYYGVKTLARKQGKAIADTFNNKNVKDLKNHYEIVFRNGTTYKFSDVDIDIVVDEDDSNKLIRFDIIHPDADVTNGVFDNNKYNQMLRFIDYSEIQHINQLRYW